MLKSTSRSKNWAYLLMHLSNTAGSLDCVEVGTLIFLPSFRPVGRGAGGLRGCYCKLKIHYTVNTGGNAPGPDRASCAHVHVHVGRQVVILRVHPLSMPMHPCPASS